MPILIRLKISQSMRENRMAKPKSLLDRMKEKAREANERREARQANFDSTNWLKIEEGDNRIRLLPHWGDEDKFPFEEKTVHYVPKKKRDGTVYNGPICCLETLDKPCPFCDAWRVAKKDNPKSKMTEALRPTKRVLWNAITFGGKDKGAEPAVRVWGCPESLHEEILGWVGDLGSFWDIDEGRNWRVRKTIDKKRGARMGTEYKVYPDMKESALPEKFKALLTDRADLSEIWAPEDEAAYAFALAELGIGDEVEEEVVTKKAAKAKPKPIVEDDEDEDDDETFGGLAEPAPRKRFEKKSKVVEDDEEDEEPAPRKRFEKKAKRVVEEDEDEEEEPTPRKKSEKPSTKSHSKKRTLDDDLGIEDELEKELRTLGI
jgi:hypothetical protein